MCFPQRYSFDFALLLSTNDHALTQSGGPANRIAILNFDSSGKSEKGSEFGLSA
jgi:hypothetical protein